LRKRRVEKSKESRKMYKYREKSSEKIARRAEKLEKRVEIYTCTAKSNAIHIFACNEIISRTFKQ
jgi:hypothetical protein